MIQQDIKDGIKTAMKEKNELRLSVLRGLSSAFTNELIANKKKPDEELADEEALGVIKRQAKQRKDSIEQFESGGRPELAESEKAELEILEAFLPETMSTEEIEKIVLSKKEELGVDDKSKMGILIGAVMRELAGRADGGDVKAVVEKILN